MDFPPAERRNILLLFAAQALFQSGAVLGFTLAAIVGLRLAPDPALTTLPVTVNIVATAVTMIPAALFMQRTSIAPFRQKCLKQGRRDRRNTFYSRTYYAGWAEKGVTFKRHGYHRPLRPRPKML